MSTRPTVAYLCVAEYADRQIIDLVATRLTESGLAVLAPGPFLPEQTVTSDEANRLLTLRSDKIPLADDVWVLAPHGRLSNEQRAEIDYAMGLDKQIRWPGDLYAEEPIFAEAFGIGAVHKIEANVANAQEDAEMLAIWRGNCWESLAEELMTSSPIDPLQVNRVVNIEQPPPLEVALTGAPVHVSPAGWQVLVDYLTACGVPTVVWQALRAVRDAAARREDQPNLTINPGKSVTVTGEFSSGIVTVGQPWHTTMDPGGIWYRDPDGRVRVTPDSREQLAGLVRGVKPGDQVQAVFRFPSRGVRVIQGRVTEYGGQKAVQGQGDTEALSRLDGTPVESLIALSLKPPTLAEPADSYFDSERGQWRLREDEDPVTSGPWQDVEPQVVMQEVLENVRPGDEVSVHLLYANGQQVWQHGKVRIDHRGNVWLDGGPMLGTKGVGLSEVVTKIEIDRLAEPTPTTYDKATGRLRDSTPMDRQEMLEVLGSVRDGDKVSAHIQYANGTRAWMHGKVSIDSHDSVWLDGHIRLGQRGVGINEIVTRIEINEPAPDEDDEEGCWVRGDIAGAGSEIVFEHPDGRLTRDDSGHIPVPGSYFKQVTPVIVERKKGQR